MARKQQVERAGEKRRRKPIVYIICEGKKTEVNYFKSYKSRESLVVVEPLPSKFQSAKELVQHAKSWLNLGVTLLMMVMKYGVFLIEMRTLMMRSNQPRILPRSWIIASPTRIQPSRYGSYFTLHINTMNW